LDDGSGGDCATGRGCGLLRNAIVSISASDCRIDAAIHKSLAAIAAAGAEPRWYFAQRSGRRRGA
jgi:hypothetical protein